MYSGSQAVRSPVSSGRTEGPVPRSIAMDANQLKARLYGKSEVYNNTRPQLKVRRRSRTSEVRIACVTPILQNHVCVFEKLHILLYVFSTYRSPFFILRVLLYMQNNLNWNHW